MALLYFLIAMTCCVAKTESGAMAFYTVNVIGQYLLVTLHVALNRACMRAVNHSNKTATVCLYL